MNEWISVKDRTPAFGEPVIVCRPYANGMCRVEQGFKDVGPWWRVYGTRVKTVTHWMPFPKPPEEAYHGSN